MSVWYSREIRLLHIEAHVLQESCREIQSL